MKGFSVIEQQKYSEYPIVNLSFVASISYNDAYAEIRSIYFVAVDGSLVTTWQFSQDKKEVFEHVRKSLINTLPYV